MKHSQIILDLMEKKGVTAYRLAKETGISESLFGKWKVKPTSRIASCNVEAIANYFGCSTDYMRGRTDNPEINR